MSLTNAKNINEEQKGDGVQDKDDNVKEEKIKEIKDNGKVTSKESNNYSVNYKDPLTTEHVMLPTPPLPPWKGRRPVQRSYSSEMLTSESYYNGDREDRNERDIGRERDNQQIQAETSVLHNGSLSKQQKSSTGRKSSNHNSHSLQRTNSQKQNNGGGRSKHSTSKEAKMKNSSRILQDSSRSPHFSSRNHHSHDSHYFVDY